ncbi:ATP-dependent RNA helicase mrh4, mitochondrial [Aspergillus campestris IBT 28561]|uniref:RNA helicase n=1 Tax=Aspergillus campestris (strain IBT 28561) TaxID=1392248 RepID=A0A2I1D3J9_ASPC2|nr:ATP-dependent RNA helicase mrh4, mitochondrial [Aspergillus campestris IBT 28561]PKY04450.1 ATP-dependent RNA helicase mrh4, mitochondrial [Aspergillus campestris IBT 28561]
MNRIGRLSLPLRPPVCLFCQTRTTILPSSPTGQAIRTMATGRRKPAARMALSSNVAKTSLKEKRSDRRGAGPFQGMNQTDARIRGPPRPRSSAALKRSGEKEDSTEKSESPLYKALKMQTTLTPMPYGRRAAVKSKIADITSFDQFPLLPVVRHSIFAQALPGMTDVTPTPIQRLAIPSLMDAPKGWRKSPKVESGEYSYDQYLLAAETGSGKTLAYLLPLVDAVKRQEAADKETEQREAEQKAKEQEEKIKNNIFDIEPEPPALSNAGRPRAVIVVPTSELVAQVATKVKALGHAVKYRSGAISSNLTPRRIKNTLFHPDGIDILVTTPHLLASIAKKEPYVLSRVSHLVLDEADSLLDRSFLPTTTEVIDKVTPSLRKLILCSATIPRSLDTLLRKRYPDIQRLTTPNLHAIPRRVQLGVVDIQKDPYRGNRQLACADVIWSIGRAGDTEPKGPFDSYMDPKVKKIMVFVNEREEADEIASFLRQKGIEASSLSRDSSTRSQDEILAEFTEQAVQPTAKEIMQAQKKRRMEDAIPFEDAQSDSSASRSRTLPNTRVLVTTDIASRGIDTLPVKTVILYDVPHNTIDFIHRLGRLGRMGKRGRAVVLVGKKDRKDVVREVREGMFRGQALI